MELETVRDVDVNGKRVLVRCDLDVPRMGRGIVDDSRIHAALPTLRYLLSHGASVVVASHLGRPRGRVDPRLRMDPVADRLADLLGQQIVKLDACVGPEVRARVGALHPGEIALLENLGFEPGDDANDPAFAARLAELADLCVNDAFPSAYRALASTVAIADHLPTVAGLLVAAEVHALTRLRDAAERPFVAVVGGLKVTERMDLVERLARDADRILAGGVLANTLLRARGFEVGRSLVEEDATGPLRALLDRCGDKFVLPVDVGVALEPDRPSARVDVGVERVPPGASILDVGHRTLEAFEDAWRDAKTVLWIGPVGLLDREDLSWGTRELARRLAPLGARGARVWAGGGETTAAVRMAGVGDRLHHVSTGGDAFVAFLAGRPMPGLERLWAPALA